MVGCDRVGCRVLKHNCMTNKSNKTSLLIFTLALSLGGFLPSPVRALWDTNLSQSIGDSRHVRMVWTGSTYGFVWQEQVGTRFQVQFREANEFGVVLSAPQIISDSPGNAFFPDIAWDGEKYAIVWQDDRFGASEIYVRFVRSGGEALGFGLRLTFHTDLGSTRQAGDATMQNFDILEGQARRIDKAAGAFQPAIFWNGKEFGIAFADARTTTAEIYFLVVRNGVKAYPEVSVTQNHQNFTRPVVVWDGEAFGLAWENRVSGGSQVLFARVNPVTGRVMNYLGVVSGFGHSAITPTLVWNGQTYFLVYEDFRAPISDLYAVEFGKQGSDNLLPVMIARDDQTGMTAKPSVIWAGDRYFLAWQDERFKKTQTFITALDTTGKKIMWDWLLSNSPSSLGPRLAWNGTGFGVVWADSRDQKIVGDKNIEAYFSIFDIWAPTAKDFKLTEVRDREATLTWQTNELSDAEVHYLERDAGTGKPVERIVTQDVWTRDHEFTITDLQPGTKYRFTVRSRDVNNNQVANEVEVTTLSYAPNIPARRPTITPASTVRPAQDPSFYAYGKPRVKNILEEHYRYLGLRRWLNSRLGRAKVDKINQPDWDRYVRAVQYGNYPASAVFQEVKGGARVSEAVPYLK